MYFIIFIKVEFCLVSKSKNAPVKLHGFEEFEVASTIFDLMELKSLDDRAELEKLLTCGSK